MKVRNKVRNIHAAIAACACLVCALPASATLISSRTALGGNDFIDWGAVSEADRFVDEATEFTTNGGLLGVLHGSGEGLVRPFFSGDFARGDQVLGTVGRPQLSITFANALSAIGAQIQDLAFDSSFLGSISVFDTFGQFLESYSLPAFSGSRTDNSALFLGISRSTADIGSVAFATSTGGPFVINRVDLFGRAGSGPPEQEAPPVASVPEPNSLALFGLALCGFAWRAKRRASGAAG